MLVVVPLQPASSDNDGMVQLRANGHHLHVAGVFYAVICGPWLRFLGNFAMVVDYTGWDDEHRALFVDRDDDFLVTSDGMLDESWHD